MAQIVGMIMICISICLDMFGSEDQELLNAVISCKLFISGLLLIIGTIIIDLVVALNDSFGKLIDVFTRAAEKQKG